MNSRSSCQVVAVILLLGQLTPSSACTGIRITPGDGSVIVGRTMEFAVDLRSDVIVIPRSTAFAGTAPGGKAGLRWEAKYGVVGANAFGRPAVVDGLNEKGLAVAIFYFPGYARYQEIRDEDVDRALAPWELASYLLGTCSSTTEAVAATRDVRVGAVTLEELGSVPPCHYVVHDAGGRCAVIEPVGGELKVHDNPLGVVTNAPTFDWHMTNLRNYVNLASTNVPPVEASEIRLVGFGQGTGMLGLPGDFTPPSRFVRAVAFTQSALPVATATEGVLQAFHILNQFDIPKGAVRGKERGKEVADCTFWTSAVDLTNLRYYFHTYENRRIRMIDLKAADLGGEEIVTIRMAGGEAIEELSGARRRRP